MKTFIFFLLATSPCLARLGETSAQCEARYGKPAGTLQKFGDRVQEEVFFKADIYIDVKFLGGKAWEITFTKAGASAFSESEILDLLQKNGENQKWKLLEGTSLRTWSRDDDGDAFVGNDNSLTVCRPHASIVDSIIEAAGAKSTGGF